MSRAFLCRPLPIPRVTVRSFAGRRDNEFVIQAQENDPAHGGDAVGTDGFTVCVSLLRHVGVGESAIHTK
jgi:hypothetical protein